MNKNYFKNRFKVFRQRLIKSSLPNTIFAFLIFIYLKLVYFSQIKKTKENLGIIDGALYSDRPSIFVFWHGRLAFVPFFSSKRKKTNVIISRHSDGEIIAKTVGFFGAKVIRGSSNDKKEKGGTEVLKSAIKCLKEGGFIVITPDGPKGPAFKAKKSVVSIARITGAKIIPVSFSCSHKKVLNSWDKFNLPLPFGKVKIKCCEPIVVPKNTKKEEEEKYLSKIENDLNTLLKEGDLSVNT